MGLPISKAYSECTTWHVYRTNDGCLALLPYPVLLYSPTLTTIGVHLRKSARFRVSQGWQSVDRKMLRG
ncbi:hypothetical protein K431DRAFT_153701 [Polychaeton citri CBS 116435]|uniref:Uncharacterized protein n=1 Tax=Polychaeton citri CBS 116435 TaxID=1314669 RepID=A0A9P4Q0Y4_9PEZI|nr:hypothetical protein K431DRAFT_153701 [Polychaeton citri CBS 116435]